VNPARIPLALYVHVPWCVRKCPYCDFNSHAFAGRLPEQEYVATLLTDLEAELELAGGRSLRSIFIGGGTPSLFSAEAIAQLLDGVRARCRLTRGCEISMEANPGTAEAGRFHGYRAAGVNRLSLGVQSLDDAKLAALGRIHSAAEVVAAVAMARAAGFDNLNLDLMYGLPGQTPQQALADLQAALDLVPEHLSWYQLTLEPNTPFHRQPPVLPEDDSVWEMQARGSRLLRAAGFRQYEVSAWARPGRRCRHNLNYWRFGDYIGIGAGAHGKLTSPAGVLRRWKARGPEQYLDPKRRLAGEQLVDRQDLPFEFMLNVLRLQQGVRPELFAERTGLALDDSQPVLAGLQARGLLRIRPRLACTARGRRFLNEVLAAFLVD